MISQLFRYNHLERYEYCHDEVQVDLTQKAARSALHEQKTLHGSGIQSDRFW